MWLVEYWSLVDNYRDKDHNIKDKDLNDEENEETMPPTDVHNKLAGLDEDNQKISNTTPPQEEYKP